MRPKFRNLRKFENGQPIGLRSTLRDTLTVQRCVTLTMKRLDGRTVHVRKATRPEPRHHELSKILGLQPNPGGTQRMLV